MLRRISIISILTIMFAGTALSVPSSADVAPGDVAVERLDGLTAETGVKFYQGQEGGHSQDGDTPTVSAQVRSPITFSMVGFELPDDMVEHGEDHESGVAFRHSPDGTTWSEWTEVVAEVDEGPDPDSPEAASDGNFSTPVWVGESAFVQTRVDKGSTEDVAVELIDATGAERSVAGRTLDAVRAAFSTSAAPAVASPGRPDIVTRAEWGADESWRSGQPSYASRVRFGVVHHTAGTNSYSQAEAKSVVRGVYAYHVKSRGWSDIGYQFLVDKFGTLYEGRYGGMDKGLIGAHAGGFNTSSFGVSLMGNYASASPTQAQFDSLAQLLAWKFELHHIDPLSTVYRTSAGSSRYSSGTTVKLNTLSGHRDVSSTTCPAGGYNLLAGLRQEIVTRSGPVIASHDASAWLLRLDKGRDGDPISFSATLRPEGTWNLEIKSPSGAVVHTETGSGTAVDTSWTPTDVAELGRYSWTISSEGRRSAGGSVDVIIDLVDRVGDGATVPEMLAGIARAAFPDPGSAGLAVIARDDVFADALGGGPLAGTQGPILFTPTSRLEPQAKAELLRVLPAGRTVYVLGGEAAISSGVAAELANTWNVVRLGGTNRYETAITIAEVVRSKHGSDTVMLARSGPDDKAPWADALAGGAWGAKAGVPVVLTATEALTPQTQQALQRWGVTRTIVLGGTAAVSTNATAGLPGAVRVAGADRAATSADIARQLWGRTTAEQGARVALADGFRADAWKPALAASPLAARSNAPLILTHPDTLSAGAAAYLSSLGHTPSNPGAAFAIGTSWRVSQSVADSASLRLQ